MVMNFFNQLSIATMSTAAIGLSFISGNPAQAASFSSDIEQNFYTGNIAEFTFENFNKTMGDVTLSIFAQADIEDAWENVGVSIHSGDNLIDLGHVFDSHINNWGGTVDGNFAEGVESLTLSESLFNSLDEVFTIKLTPNSNVNNFDSDTTASYAYIELDYVEKVPEPGTIAALSVFAVSSLLYNKKRHSASKR